MNKIGAVGSTLLIAGLFLSACKASEPVAPLMQDCTEVETTELPDKDIKFYTLPRGCFVDLGNVAAILIMRNNPPEIHPSDWEIKHLSRFLGVNPVGDDNLGWKVGPYKRNAWGMEDEDEGPSLQFEFNEEGVATIPASTGTLSLGTAEEIELVVSLQSHKKEDPYDVIIPPEPSPTATNVDFQAWTLPTDTPNPASDSQLPPQTTVPTLSADAKATQHEAWLREKFATNTPQSSPTTQVIESERVPRRVIPESVKENAIKNAVLLGGGVLLTASALAALSYARERKKEKDRNPKQARIVSRPPVVTRPISPTVTKPIQTPQETQPLNTTKIVAPPNIVEPEEIEVIRPNLNDITTSEEQREVIEKAREVIEQIRRLLAKSGRS